MQSLHKRGIATTGLPPIHSRLFAPHETMEENATQPLSQPILEARGAGRSDSRSEQDDEADVICVLHPGSPAAFQVVQWTMRSSPQHILQNNDLSLDVDDDDGLVTVIGADDTQSRAIALRLSSKLRDLRGGFCFGRNAMKCDFMLGDLDGPMHISNLHFRIYLTHEGILMLQDMSMNGTYVDNKFLKGKRNDGIPIPGQTRMLENGTIITIISSSGSELLKFVVQVPDRPNRGEEYAQNLTEYLQAVAQAERDAQAAMKAKDPFAALPEVRHPYSGARILLTDLQCLRLWYPTGTSLATRAPADPPR